MVLILHQANLKLMTIVIFAKEYYCIVMEVNGGSESWGIVNGQHLGKQCLENKIPTQTMSQDSLIWGKLLKFSVLSDFNGVFLFYILFFRLSVLLQHKCVFVLVFDIGTFWKYLAYILQEPNFHVYTNLTILGHYKVSPRHPPSPVFIWTIGLCMWDIYLHLHN